MIENLCTVNEMNLLQIEPFMTVLEWKELLSHFAQDIYYRK